MGYLVCDSCGGNYELQPGEKPEDFTDECECGGKIRYVENLEKIDSIKELVKKDIDFKRYGFCFLIFLVSFLIMIFGSPELASLSGMCGVIYFGQIYYEYGYKKEMSLPFFTEVVMYLLGFVFFVQVFLSFFNNPLLSTIYGISGIILFITGAYEHKFKK